MWVEYHGDYLQENQRLIYSLFISVLANKTLDTVTFHTACILKLLKIAKKC